MEKTITFRDTDHDYALEMIALMREGYHAIDQVSACTSKEVKRVLYTALNQALGMAQALEILTKKVEDDITMTVLVINNHQAGL